MNALCKTRLAAATLALILTAAVVPQAANADGVSLTFGAPTVNAHRHCHWEWHHHHRIQVCRRY